MNLYRNLRAYVLVLLVCFMAGGSLSAKNFRDVFLVDISASMSGQGSKTSASVFEHMRSELSEIFPKAKEAEVSLVTFGTNVLDTPTFKLPGDFPSLAEFIQGMQPRMGRTDIYQAWQAGTQLLPDTVSRLFLISDGQHNSRANSFAKLQELLSTYRANHPKTEAYLVLLDESYDGEKIVPYFEGQEGMQVIRTLKGIYDEPEIAPAPVAQPDPIPAPAPEGRPMWLWFLIAGLGLVGLIFLILFFLCLRKQQESK